MVKEWCSERHTLRAVRRGKHPCQRDGAEHMRRSRRRLLRTRELVDNRLHYLVAHSGGVRTRVLLCVLAEYAVCAAEEVEHVAIETAVRGRRHRVDGHVALSRGATWKKLARPSRRPERGGCRSAAGRWLRPRPIYASN